MSDVYLSDLRDSMQEEYIRQWEKEKNLKLLKAIEEGDDIKVGDYLEAGTEEVI